MKNAPSLWRWLGDRLRAPASHIGTLFKLMPTVVIASTTGCVGDVKIKPDHVVSVYWHKAHTLKEAADLCIDKYKVSTKPVLGVIRGCYTVVNGTCIIVAVDSEAQLDAVGHEFKHCVDGLWHTKDGFPKDGVFLVQ